MLFAAADHLNSCTGDNQDSLALSKLNLSCGERASSVADFVSASVSLRLALKALRKLDDHWKLHYDLSLRIYRAICDIELCLGNFESGNDLGQNLIGNCKKLQDKLPTFLALAVAKGRQDRHAEAMELCQTAICQLNAIPKSFHTMHMLKDNQIEKRLLKQYSSYDILMLPKMKDEKKLAAVDFLVECAARAFYCGNLA
jgi:hypothetical protein